ncbi:MAG: hypothetical protein AB7O04_06315 [Hyphomonadaceae bacterium]
MHQLNADLFEVMNFHPAILPVDSQSGASSGLVISLKGYQGCGIILMKKAGTAGDDPVFTLTQCSAVAGTGEKALNFTRIYTKLHATTVPGAFSLVTQAAGGTYTDDTAAEKAGLMAVDVKASMLDQANGFDCIRLAIPDTGSAGAQLIAALYCLYGPKYGGGAMITPIAD